MRITDQQFSQSLCRVYDEQFRKAWNRYNKYCKNKSFLEALRGKIIKRPPYLYERLGGYVGVPDAIVRFTKKLREDKLLKGYFTKTDWKI